MCGILALFHYNQQRLSSRKFPTKINSRSQSKQATNPYASSSTQIVQKLFPCLVNSISQRGRDSVSVFRTTPRQHFSWTRFGKLTPELLDTLPDSLFPEDTSHSAPPSPITSPNSPLHYSSLQHFLVQTRYVTSRALGHSYDSKTYQEWNNPSHPNNPPPLLCSQVPPLYQPEFQIAHNGTVDKAQLQLQLAKCNSYYQNPASTERLTDTQMIANLISYWSKPSSVLSPNVSQQPLELLQLALKRFISTFKTAYNLLIFHTSTQTLLAVRDPIGIRPLTMYYTNTLVCFSSESASFSLLPSDFQMTDEECEIIELTPGSIMTIRPDSNLQKFSFSCEKIKNSLIDLTTSQHHPQHNSQHNSQHQPQSCVFEYVYLADPHSVFNNIVIEHARYQMGCMLAREESYTFDPRTTAVASVPRTARPSAKGYAATLGLPYYELLQPSKKVARTFLLSNPRERYRLACQKFQVCPPSDSPLSETSSVQNVQNITTWIFVDDSLVRGNTWYAVRELLDQKLSPHHPPSATPYSYHLRLACPPIHYPDLMGIDIPTREELIANYTISDSKHNNQHQTTFPFPHPPVTLQPPGTPVSLDSLATLCRVDTIGFLSKEGVSETLSTLNPKLPPSHWSMSWHDGCYPN